VRRFIHLAFCPEERYSYCRCNFCIFIFCTTGELEKMITITREEFLADRQGRTFSDVVTGSGRPFEEALIFFNDADRQRRMEESEIHHDRAPLAGVVRELESVPAINRFLGKIHPRRSQRYRQAIGVLIRMIMERRGWRKTGRKGSLGVRNTSASSRPRHNTGGLAFWFIRAERYQHPQRRSFPSVRKRYRELAASEPEPHDIRRRKIATNSKGVSRTSSTK
jgi:hypothetical protein